MLLERGPKLRHRFSYGVPRSATLISDPRIHHKPPRRTTCVECGKYIGEFLWKELAKYGRSLPVLTFKMPVDDITEGFMPMMSTFLRCFSISMSNRFRLMYAPR